MTSSCELQDLADPPGFPVAGHGGIGGDADKARVPGHAGTKTEAHVTRRPRARRTKNERKRREVKQEGKRVLTNERGRFEGSFDSFPCCSAATGQLVFTESESKFEPASASRIPLVFWISRRIHGETDPSFRRHERGFAGTCHILFRKCLTD